MRAAATLRRRRGAKVQTGPICTSHVEKWGEKKPYMKKKMMQRRRNLFRVFTLTRGALFISTY
jgi:hypothetical protein